MSALLICALIAVVLEAQLVVAGKVGCNYDDTLCEAAEVCVDDSLFGVCIMENFARDARVAELNHAINERLMADKARSRELRVLLTFLVRADYNWRSPFTQCVIDSFRVSIISQSPAQYGLCVGVTESRTGELTSQFADASLEEMLDSSDGDVDEDRDELATQLEAAKRDEEVTVHKYFKKLDADSERRGEAARQVEELLSLSNEELARRIAQLRRQITVQLYQDGVKRAPLDAQDADADSSDSDDSDEMRNRALLLSLVNKMKERVRARLERLDAPRDSPVSRFQLAEGESDSDSEADSVDASQSAENVAQTGESAMHATGTTGDIVVDKKQDSLDKDAELRTPSNSLSEHDSIDERYGVIELADSLTSFAAEAAFEKIVDAVNWPESDCLQFIGIAGEANNALRFRMRQDCERDSATRFLDALWNNRDLVKTATRYDVVLVATGKDKLHVLNATQRANEDESNGELLITIIVCAVVLSVVLIIVIVFIICTTVRRRRKQSELDKSLLLGGSDAPETYGELCRQRMTASANEKLEAIPVPVRSLFGRSKIFAARSSPPPSKTSPDRSQVNSTSSSNAWMDEPLQTNMDITTGHAILSYMEAFLRNPEKLELEWQGLSEYEADRKATSVGQRDENVSKNRQPALLPYDHNRVVLTNYLGGDYVNASFVADHDPRSPAYIATQSPLPETATDFWQMVWEHGGNILVNLVSGMGRSADGNNNAAAQSGTSDADYRYWPSEGMETFGSLELHLVSEHLVCDDYVVRNFYLKNAVTNETRTITQFHFVSWTEHGVPSIRSLLEFRRKVIKSHHHGKSKPIVVHCSDGCGRTGTYCLIDLVLNRIAKGTVKEVDVGATIEHLRDQRVSMVKTKKQFEFALMAIADEVNAVLKALAAQQTKS